MSQRRRTRSWNYTGEQQFKVIGAREQESRSGSEMIVLQLSIGDTWGTFAQEYLVFTPGGQRNIDRFLAAIGKQVADGEEIRGHDLLNCTGRAEVDVFVDSEKPRKNGYCVVNWLPAKNSAAERVATATSPPGGAS